MKKKLAVKAICLVFVTVISATHGAAVSFPDSLLEKTVYLKHNLVFAGKSPKIFADDIVFIENQEKCDETIWELVLGKTAPVKIIAVADVGDFLRLTIVSGLRGDTEVILDKVDVLLARSERNDFWPAFDNAFSFDQVQETFVEQCEPATETELIEALGYPIYRCRKEGRSYLYYNLGFLGHRVNSFHDIWFEVKDGKVVSNFGNL